MIALTENQRERMSEIIGENSILRVVDSDGAEIWNCNDMPQSKYFAEFKDINVDRIINEIFTLLGDCGTH